MSATDADTDGGRAFVVDRWTAFVTVALVFAGAGVLSRTPGLVLSALVCAVYASYSSTTGQRALAAGPERLDPDDAAATGGSVDGIGSDAVTETAGTDDAGGRPVAPGLGIERELDPETPEPGEPVTVTVTVRNEGGTFRPDVRVVDRVPPELSVVEGSTRHAAPLPPGRESTFSYTVTATRGRYEWRAAEVAIANGSATVERATTVAAPTTLRCVRPLQSTERLPLRGLTSQYAGRIETDSGGPGVEFHATREYRPNDPLTRIDWRRLAKDGDLSTVEFREERAAKVMLVIDVRRAAYLAPDPDATHAVERSVDAAQRIFAALLEGGDRVGVTTVGRLRDDPWLAPRIGDKQRARGRELLNTHPALSPIPPERGLFDGYREDRRRELKREYAGRLHRRLSADTQVLLFSPCCDGFPVTLARRLDGYDHHVTVCSPDPTVDDAPLRSLARLERADRLRSLRQTGVRVLDWSDDETFETALASAQARWST